MKYSPIQGPGKPGDNLKEKKVNEQEKKRAQNYQAGKAPATPTGKKAEAGASKTTSAKSTSAKTTGSAGKNVTYTPVQATAVGTQSPFDKLSQNASKSPLDPLKEKAVKEWEKKRAQNYQAGKTFDVSSETKRYIRSIDRDKVTKTSALPNILKDNYVFQRYGDLNNVQRNTLVNEMRLALRYENNPDIRENILKEVGILSDVGTFRASKGYVAQRRRFDENLQAAVNSVLGDGKTTYQSLSPAQKRSVDYLKNVSGGIYKNIHSNAEGMYEGLQKSAFGKNSKELHALIEEEKKKADGGSFSERVLAEDKISILEEMFSDAQYKEDEAFVKSHFGSDRIYTVNGRNLVMSKGVKKNLNDEIAYLETERANLRGQLDAYDAGAPSTVTDRNAARKKLRMIEAELSAAKEKQNVANRYIAETQTRLRNEVDSGQVKLYSAVTKEDDFEEKSRFNEDLAAQWGNEDADYYYKVVNNAVLHNGMRARLATEGTDDEKFTLLTEDEKKIFNYHYHSGKKKEAMLYLKGLSSQLSNRLYAADVKLWTENADAHPVLTSASTILEAPARGVTGIASAIGDAVDVARGKEIDISSPSHLLGNRSRVTREAVSADMGYWGRFFYNICMSIGDNVANTIAFAPIGAVAGKAAGLSTEAVKALTSTLVSGSLAAAGASDTIVTSKLRGLSDGQSLALGFATGLTEFLTEKMALEEIMKAPKSAMLKFLRSGAIEGIEELASGTVGMIADCIIAKDDAEIIALKNEYVKNGYSETAALTLAIASSLGEQILAGFVSGGAMSGIFDAAKIRGDGTQVSGKMKDNGRVTFEDVLQNGNGEDVQFLISENEKGKYVKADRQVISGENPAIWAKQVKDYIDTEIRNGQDVNVIAEDGDILTITEDTSGKARFRNYIVRQDGTHRLMDDNEYATKLRAETHIDELAEASKRGKKIVPDEKKHPFAKDGFNYRTAYFEDIDGQYYKITMSVGLNGEIKTVYNVGKLKGIQSPSGSKAQRNISAVGGASIPNNSISQGRQKNNNNFEKIITMGEDKNDAAFSIYDNESEAAAPTAFTPEAQTRVEKVSDDAKNLIGKLGFTVTNVPHVQNMPENVDGYVDFKNREVYINPEAKNPQEVVIKHELTHILERSAGSRYVVSMREAIKKRMPKQWDQAYQKNWQKYEKLSQEDPSLAPTEKRITSETVADFAMYFAKDDVIRHYAASAENRSFIQTVKDFFQYVFLQVRAVLGKKEAAFFEACAKKWERALRDAVRDGGADTHGADVQFSIGEIKGKQDSYGIGVILDADIFGDADNAARKRIAKNYVVNHLAGESFVAYDNSGNPVEIEIANEGEAMRKSNGRLRPVLEELYRKNIHKTVKQEAVVLSNELIESSKYLQTEPSRVSHDWVDNYGKNDWEYRTVFLQQKDGSVWEATLNIANAADGRKILYDIDPIIKKEEGPVNSGQPSSNDSVPQKMPTVNSYSMQKNEKDADNDVSFSVSAGRSVSDIIAELEEVDALLENEALSDEDYRKLNRRSRKLERELTIASASINAAKAQQTESISSENTAGETESAAKAQQEDVVIGMSDDERYEVLKDKKIKPQKAEVDEGVDIDFEFLKNNIKSAVEKGLLNKLRQIGLLKKYHSVAIGDITFDFTGKGFRKSIHSQENFYGGNKAEFAKIVLNLQKLLDNSVLLEVHPDKGKGTAKEKRGLDKVFVLLSAMLDKGTVVPVQFEVEQYITGANRLYLAVALTKIETGVKGNTASVEQKATSLVPISNISISEIFKKINPSDKKLLKYVPNQFLSDEQIRAKEQAIEEDKIKYAKTQQAESISSENTAGETESAAKAQQKTERSSYHVDKLRDAVETYRKTGDSSGIPSRKSVDASKKRYAHKLDEIETELADITAEWFREDLLPAERETLLARQEQLRTERRNTIESNQVLSKVSDVLSEIDTAARPNHSWVQDIAQDLADKKNFVKDGTYGFNDFERNMRHFFGKYFGLAKEKILTPLYESKKRYAEYVEQYSDRIYNEVVQGLGIKKGSKLSEVVQWLGEKEKPSGKKAGEKLSKNWYEENGAYEPYDYACCVKEYGEETAQKIKKAADIFRECYDQMLEDINDARARIYPNNPQKQIPKRKDYFRHFQEMNNSLPGLIQTAKNHAGISPELVGVSEATKPKSKWASFAMAREGKNTKTDAVGGFLDYLPRAAYATHIDPNIVNIRSLAYDLAMAKAKDGKNGNPNANSFIRYLQNYANRLAGKTVSHLDRAIHDSTLGRPLTAAVGWFNNRAKANAVLGNFSSMLAQFANIANIVGSIKHEADLIKGAFDAGLGLFGNQAVRTEYENSGFLKERFLGKKLDRFERYGITRLAADALGIADEVGTRITWCAALREAERLGVADKYAYADSLTRRCVAGRGIGEVPLNFESTVAKLFLPFRIEVNNNINVYRDILFGEDYEGTETKKYGDITSEQNMVRVAHEIDGVFDGSGNEYRLIVLGDTTTLLKKYGASARPLTMSVNTVLKMAYPKGYLGLKDGHNLGISAVKHLVEQIKNPVAILKSNSQDNSIVLLTEWDDENGNRVIVPIHLDKNGRMGLSNEVASAYGKGNVDAILYDENGKSNVLYTKNNKSIDTLLAASGLQLPRVPSEDTLINYSILHDEEKVKENISTDFDSITTKGAGKKARGAKKAAIRTKNILRLFVFSAVLNALFGALKSDEFHPLEDLFGADDEDEERDILERLRDLGLDYADGVGDGVLFDPIGSAVQGVYQGLTEDEDAGAWEKAGLSLLRPVQNVAGDYLSNSPIAATAIGAIGVDNDAINKIFNDSLYVSPGTGAPVFSSFAKSLGYLTDGKAASAGAEAFKTFALPFGGSQIDKTARGMYEYFTGASTTKRPYERMVSGDEGTLKYLIEPNWENFVKSALFGPTAFSDAGDALYNGEKTLNEKESAEVLGLSGYHARKTLFDELIAGKEYRDADEKQKQMDEAAERYKTSVGDGSIVYQMYQEGFHNAAPFLQTYLDMSLSENDVKYETKLTADEATATNEVLAAVLAERFRELDGSDRFRAMSKEDREKHIDKIRELEHKHIKADVMHEKGIIPDDVYADMVFDYEKSKANQDRKLFVDDVQAFVESNAAVSAQQYITYLGEGRVTDEAVRQVQKYTEYASHRTPTEVDTELMELSNRLQAKNPKTYDLNAYGNASGLIQYSKSGVDYYINMPAEKTYELMATTDDACRTALSKLFKTSSYQKASDEKKADMISNVKRKTRDSIKAKLKVKYKSIAKDKFQQILDMGGTK